MISLYPQLAVLAARLIQIFIFIFKIVPRIIECLAVTSERLLTKLVALIYRLYRVFKLLCAEEQIQIVQAPRQTDNVTQTNPDRKLQTVIDQETQTNPERCLQTIAHSATQTTPSSYTQTDVRPKTLHNTVTRKTQTDGVYVELPPELPPRLPEVCKVVKTVPFQKISPYEPKKDRKQPVPGRGGSGFRFPDAQSDDDTPDLAENQNPRRPQRRALLDYSADRIQVRWAGLTKRQAATADYLSTLDEILLLQADERQFLDLQLAIEDRVSHFLRYECFDHPPPSTRVNKLIDELTANCQHSVIRYLTDHFRTLANRHRELLVLYARQHVEYSDINEEILDTLRQVQAEFLDRHYFLDSINTLNSVLSEQTQLVSTLQARLNLHMKECTQTKLPKKRTAPAPEPSSPKAEKLTNPPEEAFDIEVALTVEPSEDSIFPEEVPELRTDIADRSPDESAPQLSHHLLDEAQPLQSTPQRRPPGFNPSARPRGRLRGSTQWIPPRGRGNTCILQTFGPPPPSLLSLSIPEPTTGRSIHTRHRLRSLHSRRRRYQTSLDAARANTAPSHGHGTTTTASSEEDWD